MRGVCWREALRLQHDATVALPGGDRVGVRARTVQLLNAHNCERHLVRLNPLQLVDVEAMRKALTFDDRTFLIQS